MESENKALQQSNLNSDEKINETTPVQNKPYGKGEKGFAVFMLLIGLFFTWQSWILYQDNPGLSSCGSVPLFCSVVITLFSLITIILDRKKATENTGKPIAQILTDTWHHLFPIDVIILILFIVVYCITLYLGLGFMYVTPVFLWGSMTFLSRGNYVKNILWTALCMLFIYLVFHVMFNVVLP